MVFAWSCSLLQIFWGDLFVQVANHLVCPSFGCIVTITVWTPVMIITSWCWLNNLIIYRVICAWCSTLALLRVFLLEIRCYIYQGLDKLFTIWWHVKWRRNSLLRSDRLGHHLKINVDAYLHWVATQWYYLVFIFLKHKRIS